MPLNPRFNTTNSNAVGYLWINQAHGNVAQQQILADELADHIMKSKFPSATHIYQAWVTRKTSGVPNTPQMAHILENTIKICIGTQTQPKPIDHRQGWVAEHLWYFLVKGSYPQDSIIKLFDVSLSSTDPGGDGLVIHSTPQGVLLFRLWEIKKVSGQQTSPNATISRASGQLKENAISYLSRYVISCQEQNLPQNQKDFIDTLMDKWVEKSPDCAAGVSIVSSSHKLTNPSFDSLVENFPEFAAQNNLEGRTIGIENFEDFCDLVCRSLWNGI